jgi:hypothetical protein
MTVRPDHTPLPTTTSRYTAFRRTTSPKDAYP